MATTRIPVRTLPDIFYEDPEPVEDDMLQARPIHRIAGLLYDYYEDRPDVFVSDGGFIMYNRRNGNERVAPDCYIAFDVDVARIEEMANFWVWRVGKVPDFAMEMASPSTAANDMGHKRDLYARIGIAEYWRLDPTGGELYGHPITGERLVDDAYVQYEVRTEADGSVTSYSELLDLVFSWDEAGGFDLLDPVTRRTIDKVVIERAARLIAEAGENAEREARLAAEARADAEREARLAEQSAREAAEAQLRALQDELERLRRQQSGQ